MPPLRDDTKFLVIAIVVIFALITIFFLAFYKTSRDIPIADDFDKGVGFAVDCLKRQSLGYNMLQYNDGDCVSFLIEVDHSL